MIPLLTNPDKFSKDYIDGKRQCYINPFRFYLAVSIVFFLLVGLSMAKDKYDDLSNGTSTEIINFKFDGETDTKIDSEKKLNQKEVDSIKRIVSHEMEKSWIPVPENAKKEVLKEIDSSAVKPKKRTDSIEFSSSNSSLEKMYYFQKKNPEVKMDSALDSLKLEKNFKNRFLFTRAEYISNFLKSNEGQRQFINQLLSYGSVALFIMLPFFTLFLKLFYIRRKFIYIDHLIFVFHIQTVFFMIFSIVFILNLVGFEPKTGVFLVLFILYLLIALKKFYQQGYLKTFVKFLLLNFSFTIVASTGIAIVSLVSFALA